MSSIGVRWAALLALGLSGLAWSERAGAQSAARQPAAAQALFDEARRLMNEGDYAQACPKLLASYELDPGGGTLLNLAECYEREGRTASAWSTFKEAQLMAERDGRADRVRYAGEHVQALEGRLAYLTLDVADDARVPGLVVRVDDTTLAEAAWAVPLPVDPGRRRVRVEAPGRQPFERVVDIGAGAQVREVLAIEPLEPLAVAEAPTSSRSADTGAADAASDRGATDARSVPPLAWALGGAGVVALGVSGVFLLDAKRGWDERNELCEGGCTQAAADAGDGAKRSADRATVALAAGVVGLGVATVLWLTSDAPRASGPAASTPGVDVSVHAGGAELVVGGRF